MGNTTPVHSKLNIVMLTPVMCTSVIPGGMVLLADSDGFYISGLQVRKHWRIPLSLVTVAFFFAEFSDALRSFSAKLVTNWRVRLVLLGCHARGSCNRQRKSKSKQEKNVIIKI